tara:strand:+ start:1315 stop:1443 length:129 start_codon:yes stop_codon:yes gene_type:complete
MLTALDIKRVKITYYFSLTYVTIKPFSKTHAPEFGIGVLERF